MGDQESAGLQYEKNADKKLQGWSIFGQKNEDAAELYEKAGTCYKLAKAWNKAGGVYEKQANCHLKMESKHEAASAYFNAANCYKKMNNQEAIRCLKVSMNLCLEIGRLSMAAKHCKEVAELYQAEENLELAIEYYEKAADLYRGEEVTSTANQCLLKVAEFSAEVEQYPRAIQIFEEVSRDAVNNHLLKYSVRSYLLNAGLCYICSADTVAINNAIERYQDLDPAFSNTRECKFLMDLSAAIDEEDVDKFTDVIKEFDSMTRLDKWKTSLLLRAKNALKDKEVEEDDLT